jgi:prepilin-type N-terminal cleavage/methylation domain-containing protein
MLDAQRLTRSSARFGFTLPEMLIVIVIISVLALVAIPRFATGNAKRHMESARMRVAAALATARQAAIQKGQPVRFKIAANTVTVTVKDSLTNLLSPVPVSTLYNVTFPNVTDSLVIEYTARGFKVGSGTVNIKLRRSGVSDDSVFVTSTGMVKR